MNAKVRLTAATLLALSLGAPLSGMRAEDMADKPLATIQDGMEGVHVDVFSVMRTTGNMLTLRVAFVNGSSAAVKGSTFPGMNGSGWRPPLIDDLNKQKYVVTQFNDGSCLCTTNSIDNADFEPGQKVLWAKFTAPPESVQKIALIAGSTGPVKELPITL